MIRTLAIATALFAASAPGAAAREPSIWVQCDGQAKPEGAGTTAARVLAVTLGSGFLIGLLALPETATGTPVAQGPDGVAACTAALADPVLDQFWERKVNILRSRALHYVAADNPSAALTDLEAARKIGEGRDAPVLFERSVGVSAKLFEAVLRARQGDIETAERLAVEAADARPFSASIQSASLAVLDRRPTMSADEGRILDRRIRLDPYAFDERADRLDQSKDAGAAADAWEIALAAEQRLFPADKPGGETATATRALRLAQATLAFARAGRTERAEATRAQLLDALKPTETPEPSAPKLTRKELDASRRNQQVAALAERARTAAQSMMPLIDGYLLLANGDANGAIALLESKFVDLPRNAATLDLYMRLAKDPATAERVPPFVLAGLQQAVYPDTATRAASIDLKQFATRLPKFERVDGRFRYRGEGIPGFRNGSGYRSEARSDGVAGRRVMYGAPPSNFSGEEMRLLHAAETTKAAGYTHFVIDARGYWINSVASYPQIETYLDIRYVNEPDQETRARAIAVDDVLADLGPIYIDLPAAMAAAQAERRR